MIMEKEELRKNLAEWRSRMYITKMEFDRNMYRSKWKISNFLGELVFAVVVVCLFLMHVKHDNRAHQLEKM